MTDEKRFSPEAQRYLDGEPTPGLDQSEREAADRFDQVVRDYAANLTAPGVEVDRAVMAAVVPPASSSSAASFWRWLVQPHLFSVRPAVVAAAAIALVAIGALTMDIPGFTAGEQTAGATTDQQQTILVRFELRAPDAAEVTLAGSFNDWSPEGIQLVRNTASGLWTATVPLHPGEHQYLFVIDGSQWIPDPSAHAQVDDGFGQANSVIVVGPRGVVRS
jgi:hypothetical protein